jgi:hypothetical protein
VAPAAAQPADKFLRLQAELHRTGDGWKLSGLSQVSLE